MESKETEMQGKAQFFFKDKITVHITCNSKRFYNGLIVEISDKFLIINDRRLGETPLFFTEIIGIERYQEKGSGKSGKRGYCLRSRKNPLESQQGQ